MNISEKITSMEIKANLSTLWLFVLLNVIFRDIHELFRAGMLEEMMTGIVNGNQVTEELLLLGGIMIEIPIVMVLLSRVLKYDINRWANIIAGVFTIATVFIAGPSDLDDIFFAVVEIIALAVIIWLAWRWQVPEAAK